MDVKYKHVIGDIEFDDIRLGVKMANAAVQGKEA